MGLGQRDPLLFNKRKARRLIESLLEDSAADGDVAGEGALLVDVLALNSGRGRLEACNHNNISNH